MLPKPIRLNIPISKVDEEQRTVWGYATVEELDSAHEIVSYEASKKAFAGWIGNIREMHGDVAVGKKVEVKFDDANKGVWLGAYISKSEDGENAWIKVKEGILQGFSIGGRMNDFSIVKHDDEDVVKITDYELAEVSLVDSPAAPSAVFQMVKSSKGGLQRTEEMQKAPGRPVHWWEHMYKFADSQQIIKPSVSVYNKDSMANQDLKKDIWSASYLTQLGKELAYYISDLSFEGKDVAKLTSALKAIKDAATSELAEKEKWPEPLTDSVELAMKTLNLSKKDLEDRMPDKEKPEVAKSTSGQEDRDADAEVTTTAEDNGRPLNDTAERAAEHGLPVAGSEVEREVEKEVEVKDKDGNVVTDKDGNPKTKTETVKETVQVGPVYSEGSPAGAGNSNVADEEAKAAAEAGTVNAVTPKDEEGKTETENAEEGTPGASAPPSKKKAPKKSPKKAAEGDDLNKANDLASIVKSAVSEAVKPLEERLDKVEGKPAPSKAKGSFTTVEKSQATNDGDGGDENSGEDEQAKHKKRFDELTKRSEELAVNPMAGTPQERINIAIEMRKLSRLMDPASIAKHDAIRASFPADNK